MAKPQVTTTTRKRRSAPAAPVKAAAPDKAPQIVMLPPADLQPYERNARTHSEKQIEQIIASIKEFGWTSPLITDQKNRILAGHGRHTAALRMKTAYVPCVRIEHLTDAQRRAYIIADNRLAEMAGWDDELLRLELGELRDHEGFDLSLIGFDLPDLSKLFPQAPEDFQSYDETITVEHVCPKCGYRFSGGKVEPAAAEDADAE